MTRCGRCGEETERDHAEVCWYCRADLCVECWERYGHCGHPEAVEVNERMRAWYREHGMSATGD